MPVAVLPASSIVARNFIDWPWSHSPRWSEPGSAAKSDVVAEWIPQPAVDTVGPLRRLLGELDVFRPKLLVGLAAIRGREEEVPSRGALRHHLANLLGGLRVKRRRAGLLQQDLAGIARHVHRQPAHEPQVLVGVDLEAEFADVE